MQGSQLKSKGLGIQFLGLLILLAGVRGFFVLKGALAFLYFPGLAGAIIAFAVCLFLGGSLVKRSKQ